MKRRELFEWTRWPGELAPRGREMGDAQGGRRRSTASVGTKPVQCYVRACPFALHQCKSVFDVEKDKGQ